MFLPRPSAFSRHFIRPVYLQNVKPKLQPKIQSQEIMRSSIYKNTPQKKSTRNYSTTASPPPRPPNNEPSLFTLGMICVGAYVICNAPPPPSSSPNYRYNL
jgi:hypothetical protein